MLERIIEWSVRQALDRLRARPRCWSCGRSWRMRQTPLDAIPDLSDPQVIVFTEWMGRSPDLVEDQITYPLVRALQSTPHARTVRGYSMFGMSFIYVIFEDGTDIYWARTRVLEQLGRVQQLLPPDVSPVLGPDATGVGWVFQYALEDTFGTARPRSAARASGLHDSSQPCRPSPASPRSHRSAASSVSTRSCSIPIASPPTGSRSAT